MAVTINDYRKNREEAAAQVETQSAHAPVEQADSPDATTGDDKLDKMVRALQAVIDVLEAEIPEIAYKGMGAVPEQMFRLCQFEYMYKKGKLDATRELIKLPAQIVMESKNLV